ncbi:MAG: glycosyltransferase family 2 protein [Parvibaculum sp.]
MNTPTVSVIVCAYNAQDFIRETLDSLVSQTYRDIDILIVDDASTDGTAAICEEYAVRDSRVRIVTHPENRGLAHGRNTGIEAAHAPLILFFDADDVADPNLVQTLHHTLASDEKIMGVSCYAEYFSDEKTLGTQKIGALTRDEFMRSYKQNKLYFQSAVTLFPRELALRVGGFRTNILPNSAGIRYEDYADDLDLWCRMADLGAEGRYFLTVPEPLFRYRKPSDSLSTQNVRFMQLKMRWIKDCLRRRRAGHAERSLAEFIASRGMWQRFTDWRSDQAAGFYKLAGFAYAKRNFLALAWYLLLVGLMSPKLLRQKIATQRVTP